MVFVELSEKIISLTEQVEHLIADNSEEACAQLLSQRHALLIELHKKIEQRSDIEAEAIDDYHQFLRSIQQRDSLSLTHLDSSKKEVTKALTRQIAGSKAVSAYKNVIID